jgi:hypothetical protein
VKVKVKGEGEGEVNGAWGELAGRVPAHLCAQVTPGPGPTAATAPVPWRIRRGKGAMITEP